MYVTEEFYLHRKIYTEIFLVIGKLKIQVSSSFKICWFNCCWYQYNIIICIYKLPWRKNRNKYFNCEICEKRSSSNRYKAQHLFMEEKNNFKKKFQLWFLLKILDPISNFEAFEKNSWAIGITTFLMFYIYKWFNILNSQIPLLQKIWI